MIRGVWDYVEAIDKGRFHYAPFRKAPSQAGTASNWFDISMSPGMPLPQYYAAAPLVGQQMKKSTDGGLNHGPSVQADGYQKYLKRFLIMTSSQTGLPLPYILMDYVHYYPFIDMGTNDEQIMDNTNALARYTDGAGLQMMPVSVASGTALAPKFTVNYTNSDGVAGRTSKLVTCSLATANGSILTCHHGLSSVLGNSPFIGLQDGDKGVRSIESVTFPSTLDVGLFTIALVKPLVTGTLSEPQSPSEIECLPHQSQLPKIYDDAYLNIIACPNAAINGISFNGEIETIWNK
jgi:hypothetical protein